MTQQFISDHKEQLPNQLTSAEYQELHQESGIHPDLIKLNFFHLEGNDALDRLFISDKLKRINTGAISYSILKRYRHVEFGGWWVSGVDVLNQYSDDLWGQFKPTKPRLSADKGKIIKYEGPPKHPTGIIALKISQLLWQTIANRNNIKLSDYPKGLLKDTPADIASRDAICGAVSFRTLGANPLGRAYASRSRLSIITWYKLKLKTAVKFKQRDRTITRINMILFSYTPTS